jgi:hypothetical protein
MRILALVLLIAGMALWLIGGSIVHIRAGKRLGTSRKSLGIWLPIWVPWRKLTGHERLKIMALGLPLIGAYIFSQLVYAS